MASVNLEMVSQINDRMIMVALLMSAVSGLSQIEHPAAIALSIIGPGVLYLIDVTRLKVELSNTKEQLEEVRDRLARFLEGDEPVKGSLVVDGLMFTDSGGENS